MGHARFRTARAEPTRLGEIVGLQPFPDALLEGAIDLPLGPEARYEQREAVSLAFVSALQALPPRQLAVLILRNVLGFRADEVSEMPAGLQHQRASQDGSRPPAPGSASEETIVAKFVRAWESADVNALVALLTDDVFMSMPPVPFEHQGRDVVARFCDGIFRADRRFDLVPTRANGQPAFGAYLRGPNGVSHGTGLYVLTLAGDRICAMTRFEKTVFREHRAAVARATALASQPGAWYLGTHGADGSTGDRPVAVLRAPDTYRQNRGRDSMTTPTEADFVVLYRENYSDVERFVARRADPARVDDIVGETFLAAWRRRAELPGEPRPWLFRTARNTILNAHRGERRQRAVAVRIAATSVFEVSDPTSSVDASLDVVGAWQRLDERDQEVLALHVWDDLDDRDAAAVLGCSRAAYAMRLTRARRRLARLLQTDTLSLSYAPLVPKEQS